MIYWTDLSYLTLKASFGRLGQCDTQNVWYVSYGTSRSAGCLHWIHLRRMGYKAHHRSSVGVLLRIVNVHHENQWFAEQSRGSIRNGLSAQQRAFEKERTVHLDFMANWLDCSKAKVSEDLSQWNTRPDPTFLLSALVGREGMKVLWDEVEEKNVGSKKIMSEKELENARRQVVKRQ